MAQAMHDPKKVSKKSPKKKLFSHTYINIQYLCARNTALSVKAQRCLLYGFGHKKLNINK